jgi:hypothetical protein
MTRVEQPDRKMLRANNIAARRHLAQPPCSTPFIRSELLQGN